MMIKNGLFWGLMVCHAVIAMASTQAKFSLVPKTQTAVTVPANRHVYVQYKVTNNTAITRTLTMVPIANVVQKVDESGACTAPFTLASGESCNLTLYIEGSNLTSNYYGGPVVCKTQTNTNTPDLFLCSQPEETAVLSINTVLAVPPTTHKLYVSNWTGNSISMCYLNAGNPEYCAVSGLSTSFANPEALAISGDMLFIANIGGGMSSCLIDPVTGDLSNCQIATDTEDSGQIFAPDGIAIDGGTAYISNSGPEHFHQGITVCTVSGAFLTNCNFIQANAAFSVPSDLAIVDGTVYVTNFNSQELQTTWCSLADPLCTTGNGTGMISGTGSLLNKPEGLIFATINTTTYAYFTNEGNNKVVICTVNGPTSFSNCGVTNGYFTGFGNLAVLVDELKAILPSGIKSLAVCDLSGTDGSLSNCANSTEASFYDPSGLVIQ